MPVTERTFHQVALEDSDRQRELHHGVLREKPSMSFRHNDLMMELGFQLRMQLDPSRYRIRINVGRVSRWTETYYIPDVFVIPVSVLEPDRDRPDILEIYDRPLPIVVEIRSLSTGEYDVNTKLPEYRLRGYQEVWRIQPFERVLHVWRRQPDGTYQKDECRGGDVVVESLPDVMIDLETLFV
ncbi:MAG TPA: Uma2 family endonuclease [Thermomicrobiales bacterium]|nr:Uma2 family endonuclease [Thermomicrobiales bacterium]